MPHGYTDLMTEYILTLSTATNYIHVYLVFLSTCTRQDEWKAEGSDGHSPSRVLASTQVEHMRKQEAEAGVRLM